MRSELALVIPEGVSERDPDDAPNNSANDYTSEYNDTTPLDS
jgi:hypothetical protein